MKGLYIHIPFCVRKCKYCDFVSFEGMSDKFKSYVEMLKKEMKLYNGEEIDSIFIGGGTPTVLDAEELKNITDGIFENFRVKKNAEFTIEANPGTVSKEKLLKMREMGINRISIGVQSFNDSELSKIGRIHTAEMAKEAVETARKCGFLNINIDLMFSLPGETLESFKRTLDTAFSLDPRHISCYSLILEEGTPLYDEYEKGVLSLKSEDEDRELYEFACREFSKHGYHQYEISNFAKDGYECRHNLKYWNCEEYIGLGVAAHSYCDDIRYFNTSSLERYMQGEYIEEKTDKLSDDDKIKEFIIMGLRKTEGISKTEFQKRFNADVCELFGEQIERFKTLKLMEENGDFLRLTFDGINVSNSVLCEFI